MKLSFAIAGAWLVAAAVAAEEREPEPAAAAAFAPATMADPGSLLPDGPVKPLVLARCDKCHGLAWIERSGGSEEGWLSRIRRMNRAGAMVPAEEIPILAAYLAQALPERLRPVEPAKERATDSFRSTGDSP
jgi:hypothetical protein